MLDTTPRPEGLSAAQAEGLKALARTAMTQLELRRGIADRRTEAAILADSELRLRLAVEAAGVGIFDYDLVAGTLAWDGRTRALFGVGPDEAVSYAGTFLARLRLPIVPPAVTQLTGQDAPNRPYGELIDLGQQRMKEAPYAGRVLNVSVMGGFAFADTPFNGLTVVVTATDQAAADGLAEEIAAAGWARRDRFRPTLTSLEEATRLATTTQTPLIFADVADNPGGGGRGTTMSILQAFHAAGVKNALVGVIHDPALAAEARERGVGATFEARFNRDGGDAF